MATGALEKGDLRHMAQTRTDVLNDEQVMHAMSVDDAYTVERVLADRADGVTELVTIEGAGPFVRRRIPSTLARRGVWAALAECSCARLPQVQATYEMPDAFVVVYDFVPGKTVEQLVDARGRLPQDEAVRLAREVCEAASALHAHCVVHRDISPGNVIVAADGAHLIDLGISRMVVEGASKDTTQLGTWGFAAPEQYGFAQTDARSDVWSIGRLLGYLLCGVRPDDEKFEQLIADPGVVAPWLHAVIERACAFEPSARYQSAAALAAALEGREDASTVNASTVNTSRSKEPSAGPQLEWGAPAAHSPSFDQGASSAQAGRWTESCPDVPDVSVGAARPRGKNWLKGLLAAMAVVAFVAAVILAFAEVFGWGSKPSGDADLTGDKGAQQQGQLLPGEQTVQSDAAPSDSGSSPEGSTKNAAGGLEVGESGWSLASGGLVNYGLTLKNASSEYSIRYPQITITGRGADGSVVFSDTMTFSMIAPGETYYATDLAGNGTAPATVEFSVVEPEEYNLLPEAGVTEFAVSGVRETVGRLGATSFTGEIAMTSDDPESLSLGQARISVILRDSDGNIVGGCYGFVEKPALGESAPFEVSSFGLPDHATFEIHAEPW